MFVRPEQGTPEAVSGPTAMTTLEASSYALVSMGTSSQMIL